MLSIPVRCASAMPLHPTRRLPPAPLEPLGTSVLVWVVPVRTLTIDIVLVVHVLSLSLGLSLRLLAVEEVLALCLRELVDLGACEASKKLLGELVGYRLA